MQEYLAFSAFEKAMQKPGIAESRPRIAVAVSGGGDSLALALLMNDWVKVRGGEMLALTVNHNLRAEAAAEADEVHALMQKRGIAHQILEWTGDKPQTGIQERARAARYELLVAACRKNDFSVLALAHNREDQIETFWMRLAHGSGLDGLAGMAGSRNREGISIIRPLLSCSRAELREVCKSNDIAWIEDPSNHNGKYLRTKLRGFENLLAEEGLSPARLSETLQKLEDAREALQAMADHAALSCLALHPGGYVALKPEQWKKQPKDIQRRLLARALFALSPEEYPVRFDAIEALRLDLQDEMFKGRTLSGCELFLSHGEVLIAREAVATEGRVPLEEGGIWDRRFVLSGFPCDESLEIGPLAPEGLSALRKNSAPIPELEKLPFKVKCALPALWQGENLLAVPHVSYYNPAAPAGLNKGKISFAARLFNEAA